MDSLAEPTESSYPSWFGEFANGRELPVSGTVSAKFAEGTEEELGLAGVSVNGVAADLDWSAVKPQPVGRDRRARRGHGRPGGPSLPDHQIYAFVSDLTGNDRSR